ncbi:LOW QUALITY PROTEIN: hypothetical protein PanWU01x14_235030 [Parasponia andersonii]|uniref:Uncharacterized protein n=1 Tax=Parasponia andersonii TaxID=3476 RepID=A0A2P5BJ31_PARAD|nr:LOW QUALITY PROTEIN: hypothetical protein PanWU01x14_235030 [Parasponia andersonii]
MVFCSGKRLTLMRDNLVTVTNALLESNIHLVLLLRIHFPLNQSRFCFSRQHLIRYLIGLCLFIFVYSHIIVFLCFFILNIVFFPDNHFTVSKIFHRNVPCTFNLRGTIIMILLRIPLNISASFLSRRIFNHHPIIVLTTQTHIRSARPSLTFILRLILYHLLTNLSYKVVLPFKELQSPPQIPQIPLHQEKPLLQCQVLFLQLGYMGVLIIHPILQHVVIISPAIVRVYHLEPAQIMVQPPLYLYMLLHITLTRPTTTFLIILLIIPRGTKPNQPFHRPVAINTPLLFRHIPQNLPRRREYRRRKHSRRHRARGHQRGDTARLLGPDYKRGSVPWRIRRKPIVKLLLGVVKFPGF